MRNILLIIVCIAGMRMSSIAQISVSNMRPQVGEQLEITVARPVESLRITYRPNSQVERIEILPLDAGATSVKWSPKRAGVVAISDGTNATNVSVRFQGVSWPGLIVMAIAALLLFGGATFAFRLLFKDEEEDGTLDLDLEHMPDT